MPASLTLDPIGFVRSALGTKVEAARQPRASRGVAGTIELVAGKNYEHALQDLDGWEYIWVIFWFDRNAGWRPKVLPPRSRSGRKGVFATRSPHRPNPLGLSVVRLERIEGLTLHVTELDILDGTPVLDIKPYVAYTDALPQARSGWLDDAACVESGERAEQAEGAGLPEDPVAAFEVAFDARAADQAAWIEACTGLALRDRATATLSLGPEPHAYRRIRRSGDALVLAVKEWRLQCSVAGRRIVVHEVTSGYRDSQLASPSRDGADLGAHRDFRTQFGAAPKPERDAEPGAQPGLRALTTE